MKLGALVEILKKKDLTQDVEYIICDKEGALVAMEINGKAQDFVKVLSLFGPKAKEESL